jgi:hypothetical protein
MKKLLLLTAIATTIFACGDKPEAEADINYLKGNVFGGIYSGTISYKLYFVDDNTVYMHYRPDRHYTDSITRPDDSVINLTYSIYETIKDSVQSFYIGLSNSEQLISDTVWRGNLYLSDTKRFSELIEKGRLDLYYRVVSDYYVGYGIYNKQ